MRNALPKVYSMTCQIIRYLLADLNHQRVVSQRPYSLSNDEGAYMNTVEIKLKDQGPYLVKAR
jgi:hypothetical protein